MTIGKHWRLYGVNEIGQTLVVTGTDAFDVYYEGIKRAADGSISYQGSEQALSYTTPDLADGDRAVFGTVNNSVDLFEEIYGRIVVTAGNVAANGTIEVYVEYSTDGGSTFPSDAANFNAREDGEWLNSLRINNASAGAGYQKAVPFHIKLG